MTWKLRDTRLHELLNEATKGEFSKKLIDAVKSGSMVVELFSGSPKLSIHLVGNDIEEIPEYNPHAWNKFPDVVPPKDVWMRIENKDGWGGKAIWTGAFWHSSTRILLTGKEYRFRPWGD